jgi:ketosteroid isomerase-like protein
VGGRRFSRLSLNATFEIITYINDLVIFVINRYFMGMKGVNMMNEQENIQKLQQHFEAFGKGNLAAALDMVADNVDWQSPVTRTKSQDISWSTPRHSREEVFLFFKELSEKVQPEGMEIFAFTAQGDRVIVEGRNRGTVKSTGNSYDHDWVMVFTFSNGKIVRHRHYYDTNDILVAFHKD